MIAYAWGSGLIEFGEFTPDGALPLVTADREIIEVCARHGYKDGVLLVPGWPEADDLDAAFDALIEFNKMLQQRLAA